MSSFLDDADYDDLLVAWDALERLIERRRRAQEDDTTDEQALFDVGWMSAVQYLVTSEIPDDYAPFVERQRARSERRLQRAVELMQRAPRPERTAPCGKPPPRCALGRSRRPYEPKRIFRRL